jgi:hypothetical protein
LRNHAQTFYSQRFFFSPFDSVHCEEKNCADCFSFRVVTIRTRIRNATRSLSTGLIRRTDDSALERLVGRSDEPLNGHPAVALSITASRFAMFMNWISWRRPARLSGNAGLQPAYRPKITSVSRKPIKNRRSIAKAR